MRIGIIPVFVVYVHGKSIEVKDNFYWNELAEIKI